MKRQSQSFTQEPHSCISPDDEPVLRLELRDAGAGEYLVLHATAWAMDSEAEVDQLAEAMKAMLKEARV